MASGSNCTTTGVVADHREDDFARVRARGEAANAGWIVGEHSDGRSDFCPARRWDAI